MTESGSNGRLGTGPEMPIDLESEMNDMENYHDLTFLDHLGTNVSYPSPPSGMPIISLNEHVHLGNTYHKGLGAEFANGDFLLIRSIALHTESDEVHLRGHLVRRTKELGGMLEKKLNEAYLVIEMCLDDPRAMENNGLIDVPLSRVVRPRDIRLTNRKFPHWRAIPNVFTREEVPQLMAIGPLTVRWILSTYYRTAVDKTKGKYVEMSFTRLPVSEASDGFAMSDHSLWHRWRRDETTSQPVQRTIDNHQAGNSLLGSRTSPIDLEQSVTEMSITSDRSSGINVNSAPNIPSAMSAPQGNYGRTIRAYTVGDAFCGVGGFSRGAEMAGANVLWGFDNNEFARGAWSLNFPGGEAWCKSADEFCNIAAAMPNDMKVDILHISAPCQVWSPAHTRPGRDDEFNVAALFAVSELIKKCRPRVVTIEQTFGLTRNTEFRPYFNTLVNMFTSLNFSVRWSVVPLVQWGLPQFRKRLIMIASCPGEVLPKMPLPTHSENGSGGLRPYATVNEAISGLQINAHNDSDFKLFDLDRQKSPYDGNQPLKGTITTNGGEVCHPSGTRKFTYRELAALQGFPPEHIFTGFKTQKTKQIGNAVPPVVARVLCESIIKELKQADGIIDEEDYIIID